MDIQCPKCGATTNNWFNWQIDICCVCGQLTGPLVREVRTANGHLSFCQTCFGQLEVNHYSIVAQDGTVKVKYTNALQE